MHVMSRYTYRAVVSALLIIPLLAGCQAPEVRKQKAYEKGLVFMETGETRKAILEFRNAIQIDPKFADARYGLGLCLLKQENYGAAALELKKVREAKPELTELKPYLAEAFVGAGEFEDGRQLCEELIAENPEDPKIYDFLSRALFGLSEKERIELSDNSEQRVRQYLEDAVMNAQRALELDPELVEPHITLVRALVAERRYSLPATPLSEADIAKVRAHFDAAKRNRPDDARLLRRIASSWSWAGIRPEALKEIEEALAVAPDDGDARIVKAELLFDDGNVDAAQTIAERLIEDKFGSARIDFLMGRIWLSKGEIEKARDEFQKVKNNVSGGYFYAVCLERLGQREQALSQFKAVLDIMPAHEGARRALFELYMRAGNLERAALEADEIASLMPASSVGYILRARLAMARRDWEGAHAAVSEALKLDPRSTDALLIRANVYRSQGEPASALASVNELVNLRPDSAIGYQVRSEMHLTAREFEKAEADARRAAELAPKDPRSRVTMARARLSRKDISGAIGAYQEALELAPNDASIRFAFAGLHASQKEYDKAIELLEPISEDDVLYVQARRRIAEIYDAKGDVETAVTEFKNLMAKHPDAADVTTGLFQHYRRSADFAQAEQLANDAVEKDPTDPLGHLMLSDLYASRGLWARATDEMKAAAALRPDSSRLHFRLGALNAAAGRLGDALNAFQRARELQQDFDMATLGAAKVLARLGRADEGADLCARVVQRSPADLNAQLAMADIMVAQGKKAEAGELYRKIIATNERFLLPYVRLAALYESDQKPEAARSVFDDALVAAPQVPELYVEYGRLWERQGDKQRARQQYTKALGLSPEDPRIIDLLARISAEAGDYGAAERQLHARIQREPRDLRARLNLALVLERQGKSDEATASLFDFITASDDPEATGMELSRIFMSMRRYDEIERLAQSLLDADSENWMAHYVLGIASAGKGDSETAQGHFDKAAGLNRDMPLARHAEGAMYARMNKIEEALKAFEAARDIDAQFLPAFTDAALIHLQRKEFDAAVDLCRSALRANPQATKAVVLQAVAYVRSGRHERAVSTVRDLLDKAPGQAVIASSIADVLSLEGNHDAAISLCKRCLAAAPDNPVIVMRLGGLYERAGKADLAENEYRQLVRLAPNSAAAHNNLAWLLAEHDKLDEALTHAERARELSPNHPAFLDTLGWIHFKKGNVEEALPLLEVAAQTVSQNPEILYHLAKAYVQVGRNDDARPLLERALSTDTSFSDADDARAELDKIAARNEG